jgi:hypothetical protein
MVVNTVVVDTVVVNTAVVNGGRQFDWVDKLAVSTAVNSSVVVDAGVVITVVVNMGLSIWRSEYCDSG